VSPVLLAAAVVPTVVTAHLMTMIPIRIYGLFNIESDGLILAMIVILILYEFFYDNECIISCVLQAFEWIL
jgi:hypothetical protein